MGFNELLNEAENMPPGNEGSIFLTLPENGERTPYPDPLARGAFVGLTVRHGRGPHDQGGAGRCSFWSERQFQSHPRRRPGDISQVRASGGGTKGVLWRQILALVLEAELVTVNTPEGAAYGAALLAGVSAGVWPDVPLPAMRWIRSPDRSFLTQGRLRRIGNLMKFIGIYIPL